ncbi:MAG: thioester domain-containing protein [Candidatus Acidiferrales bacterium]
MRNIGKLLIVAASVLMFVAPSAFADADSTVVFNGSYAFGNNGVGIPPYGGTLNGQSEEFYCVDFSHDIVAWDTWPAIVTPLSNTSNYSPTYLYTGNNATTETIYQEFAWLITQEMSAPSNDAAAADQWAIWSLSGGNDPYTGPTDNATFLLGQALDAVDSGFTGQGWEILTPDNAAGGQGQEFMVYTPEPSGLLLLGMGLCALIFVKRREWFGMRGSLARSDS